MMSQHKPNADEKQHCLMGTSGSRKKTIQFTLKILLYSIYNIHKIP